MILVVLALGWLGGMAAVALWGAGAWYGPLVAVALAPAVYAKLGRDAALLCLSAGLLAAAGAVCLDGWLDRDIPAFETGTEVTLTGVIASEGEPGLTTLRYRLDVDRSDGEPAVGSLLITLGQFDTLLPGDEVTVSGTIEAAPVFDEFDYRGFLREQGISGTMLFPAVEVIGTDSSWRRQRAAAEARLDLEDSLQRSLPEPEASLAAGISFGMDSNIPADLYANFRDAGLAHIVAVSGANVTYVAAFVFLLLTPWLGVRLATVPAAATIVLYLVAAGLTASVVRAGIMACVFLLGAVLGRQRSSLAALGAAVIVMTALGPSAAVDVGFQLSVAATAGLIVFSPWIRAGLDVGLTRVHARDWIPSIALQAAALSLAASVATLPLIWFHFGRISLIGPVANVVVEPLFVFAFALSLATAAAGLISPELGWLLGLAAYYPLAFICWFAEACASLPFAAVDVEDISATTCFLLLMGFIAVGALAYVKLAPFPVPRDPSPSARHAWRIAAGAAAGGLALAFVVVSLLPARGPGELEVHFLDVGQGDAILVTTPGGQHVLVDGGPSGIALARELGAVLPHWERDIEVVILTHPHQDHLAGLPEVLDRFEAGTVSGNGVTNHTQAFDEFARLAEERDDLRAGDSFQVDGVLFEVLWPEELMDDLNNDSLVVRVVYGGTSILLTGDIESEAQAELLAIGHADVLKVPHHGADTSLSSFFDAVEPTLSIITVGAGNRFGHPGDETLANLSKHTVYRTDVDGRVTIRSDGDSITVSTER